MKSYITYFRLKIITNLQYRSAALAGMGTQLFFGLVYIMVYLAFYSSGGTNLPMNIKELVTYMWLQQAFFALVYPYETDTELTTIIKNGNLAYELIRPQNFYLKFFLKAVSKKIIGALLRCWPILLIGFILPSPYSLGLPASPQNLLIFILALLLACFLNSSLSVIVNILGMYSMDTRGFISTYNVIAELFLGGIIPIPFFPMWMQKIANLLPFKYIGDFPFRVYSGSISVSNGYILLLCSLSWVVCIIILDLLVSKNALKKAVIQGG